MGFANPIVCKHRSLFHQEAQFNLYLDQAGFWAINLGRLVFI